MTTSETVLVIIGGFLLAGAVLAVAREAMKRNWVRFAFSFGFGITTPDARLLKPLKADNKATPEPAAEAPAEVKTLAEKRAS